MVILTNQSSAHPELLHPLNLLMRCARDGVRGHRMHVLAISYLLVTRTLPAYDNATISDACSRGPQNLLAQGIQPVSLIPIKACAERLFEARWQLLQLWQLAVLRIRREVMHDNLLRDRLVRPNGLQTLLRLGSTRLCYVFLFH